MAQRKLFNNKHIATGRHEAAEPDLGSCRSRHKGMNFWVSWQKKVLSSVGLGRNVSKQA
jgi:hypothetical protein